MNETTKREFEIEEEKCHLLRIFPEEIWQIILTNLKNPEDLTRISNSNMFFRNCLLSQRTTFLFPGVWNILGKAYETSDSLAYTERTTPLTGRKEDYKWFTGILKLRLVSRFWNKVIDNFYQHFQDIYAIQHDYTQPKRLHKVCLIYEYEQDARWTRRDKLVTPLDISDFRDRFDETHAKQKSPFIANALRIELENNYSEEFMQELKLFLEDYGQFVWHIGIYIAHNLSLTRVYSILHSICTLVPNLLTLRIDYMQKARDGKVKCRFSRRELEILQQSIESLPMPTWRNLKVLITVILPVPILNELLDKNRQVERLHVMGFSPENTRGWSFQGLSKVTQVFLKFFARSDLEALQLTNWKLEKVHLNFSECSDFSWSEIFQIVENKWTETATNVMLRLPKVISKEEIDKHYEEFGSLRLNLSKVKHLTLILPSLSLIDFVLPMKQTLEQLEISMPRSSKSESDKVCFWNGAEIDERVKYAKTIELFDLKNFYDSNIWTLFPKLQRLFLCSSSVFNFGRTIECTRTKWLLRAGNYM